MVLQGDDQLYRYLELLQERCEEMHQTIMTRKIEEAKKSEGLCEEMKNTDMMKWIGIMNRLTEETIQQVSRELIYNQEPEMEWQ